MCAPHGVDTVLQAANRNLAETTKRLEEEKERMDVLLVRQYDLLRCLDANRSDGKINVSDTVGSSKKAMMGESRWGWLDGWGI